MHYLPVWTSPHKVGLSHAHPHLLDLIYLLIEEVLSLLHGHFELVCIDRPKRDQMGLQGSAERLATNQKVAGSSPAERALSKRISRRPCRLGDL